MGRTSLPSLAAFVLGCGPGATFIASPADVEYVAAVGVDSGGRAMGTPLSPTREGAELSFDQEPATITILGFSGADLAPHEAHRDRWATDEVFIPRGCEKRLPAPRWVVRRENGAYLEIAVDSAPPLTAAWIDEARDCQDLDVEVEVRCGTIPALCLVDEQRSGACSVELPLCPQVGGQVLEIDLDEEGRICPLDARDCMPAARDGALELACPAHTGVACTATPRVFRKSAPPLRLTRDVPLPVAGAYAPSAGAREDVLDLDHADQGFGSDLIVVGDVLIVQGLSDDSGSLVAKSLRRCQPELPSRFFFYDATNGARRAELDRAAPTCSSWLAPAPGGFSGLARLGPDTYVLHQFDARGVETSSLTLSMPDLSRGFEIVALHPRATASGETLLLVLRRGRHSDLLGAESRVLRLELSSSAPPRIVWTQDFHDLDDETYVRAFGFLGADRVVALDSAADQLFWFDVAAGSYLGSARVQPFESARIQHGPAWSAPTSSSLLMPVGRTRGGIITLDGNLTQSGIGEYTKNRAITGIVGLGDAADVPIAFLHDPDSERALATIVRAGEPAHLDPHQLELPAFGPARSPTHHAGGAWVLLPWSGRLVRIELAN